MAASLDPATSASVAARGQGLHTRQLFIWRRQFLSEAIASGLGGDGFVPVAIANEPAAAVCSGSAGAGERVIEIRLPNGIVIGVGNAVEVEPLRRVLTALAGR